MALAQMCRTFATAPLADCSDKTIVRLRGDRGAGPKIALELRRISIYLGRVFTGYGCVRRPGRSILGRIIIHSHFAQLTS
jgi:hypothetical protein